MPYLPKKSPCPKCPKFWRPIVPSRSLLEQCKMKGSSTPLHSGQQTIQKRDPRRQKCCQLCLDSDILNLFLFSIFCNKLEQQNMARTPIDFSKHIPEFDQNTPQLDEHNQRFNYHIFKKISLKSFMPGSKCTSFKCARVQVCQEQVKKPI